LRDHTKRRRLDAVARTAAVHDPMQEQTVHRRLARAGGVSREAIQQRDKIEPGVIEAWIKGRGCAAVDSVVSVICGVDGGIRRLIQGHDSQIVSLRGCCPGTATVMQGWRRVAVSEMTIAINRALPTNGIQLTRARVFSPSATRGVCRIGQ
jgi:hypothetical protein